MRKKNTIVALLSIALFLLTSCGIQKGSFDMLAEKGIVVNNFDTEDNHKGIDNLSSFWKKLPKAENEIKTDIDNEIAFDLYLGILTEAFNEIDYGNAYGLTYYLCRKYNLCSTENIELVKLNEDELYILDLSEPLFDERISDEDNINKAKAIAVYFTEYVQQKYGLDKLVEITVHSKPDELVELKNEWLVSLGYEYKYEICSGTRLIADENNEYPYYTLSDSYIYHFSLDDINKLGYVKYFGEYSQIAPMIEEDFSDAREKFWKSNENVEPVNIYTCFSEDNRINATETEVGGIYYPDENSIRMYVDWTTSELSLVHEYIHYLDREFVNKIDMLMLKKQALLETYTSEVSIYECQNQLLKDGSAKYFGIDYLESLGVVKNGEVDNALLDELVTRRFLEARGIEIISATLNKNTVVGDVIPWDFLPGHVNGSFFHSLIEKYGKEKIVDLTYNTKEFDDFISTDYEKLYYEWVQYVMSDGL